VINNNNFIIPVGAVTGRLVVTGSAVVDFTANGSIIVFRGGIPNIISFQAPFTAQFLGSKNVSVRISSSVLFQVDAPFPSNTLESYALNYISTAINGSVFRFTVANNIDWSLGVGGLQAAQEENYIFGNFLRNNAPTGDVSKIPSGDCRVYFAASSGTKTITCSANWNGISLIFSPTNPSVTYNLNSNITQSNNQRSTFTWDSNEAATLNTNNNTITTNGFYANNKGTINFGSSTVNVNANNFSSPVVFASFAPNIVLNSGTSTFKALSGSGELTAANKTLHNVEIATTGTITIAANSPNTTINTLSNSVTPTAITFPSGATTTINNFSLSGAAGNRVTIRSTTAGQRATIAKASGVVDGVSLDIKDSIATGGATWQANLVTNGNIDSGNNVGWNFFKGSLFQFLQKF
jgi:hypothetical protein